MGLSAPSDISTAVAHPEWSLAAVFNLILSSPKLHHSAVKKRVRAIAQAIHKSPTHYSRYSLQVGDGADVLYAVWSDLGRSLAGSQSQHLPQLFWQVFGGLFQQISPSEAEIFNEIRGLGRHKSQGFKGFSPSPVKYGRMELVRGHRVLFLENMVLRVSPPFKCEPIVVPVSKKSLRSD